MLINDANLTKTTETKRGTVREYSSVWYWDDGSVGLTFATTINGRQTFEDWFIVLEYGKARRNSLKSEWLYRSFRERVSGRRKADGFRA